MLDSSQKLSYCNQQADNFFGVTLSHIERIPSLGKSQYLIMDKRCLHELHTQDSGTVAEKMQESEGSKTIDETDLCENVLSLTEALLTFSVKTESAMFNIKLSADEKN